MPKRYKDSELFKIMFFYLKKYLGGFLFRVFLCLFVIFCLVIVCFLRSCKAGGKCRSIY